MKTAERITARHPARAAIAALPNYFDYKGHAWDAVNTILAGYGWELDCFEMPGSEGRTLADVIATNSENCEPVGQCCLAWYRMPSGRYEFTIYLS